jgi:hypothetical protein
MAQERERLDQANGPDRFIRRDEQGRFTEDQVEVGKSISQDMRRKAKTKAPRGQGDKGDHNVSQQGDK